MPEITVKVRGVEQVKDFIGSLPRNLRGLATKAIADYFIGTGQHGLKRYPPYKHIKRAKAYPDVYFTAKDGHKVYGFSSLAQLRKVAAIMEEKPAGVPHRTGNYQRGWEIINKGVKVQIINDVPYAGFVGGDKKQANLNAMVGWRKAMDIISTNWKGAIRHANAEIGKWIKARK
jgi:hypothetical protein